MFVQLNKTRQNDARYITEQIKTKIKTKILRRIRRPEDVVDSLDSWILKKLIHEDEGHYKIKRNKSKSRHVSSHMGNKTRE